MEKLKSRKFWMSIVGGVLVILNDGIGLSLPTETVVSFAGIIMSYIFSQGYVDSKS